MKLSGTGLEWNCAEWKDYFGGNCLVSDKTLGWNYLRGNNWGGIVGGGIVRGGVVQDGVVWGGIVQGGIVRGGVVQGGTVWSLTKL